MRCHHTSAVKIRRIASASGDAPCRRTNASSLLDFDVFRLLDQLRWTGPDLLYDGTDDFDDVLRPEVAPAAADAVVEISENVLFLTGVLSRPRVI